MGTSELIIWSCMTGGLLTLVAIVMTDVLINRKTSSWRALLFTVLSGGSCVVMSGVVDVMFPGIPSSMLIVTKVSLAPLGAALGLTYLGMWLGVAIDDPMVHHTIVVGVVAAVAATMVLVVFSLYLGADTQTLILLSAAISALSLSLGIFAALRTALLGDPLARWMALAQAFLAIALLGLYRHQLPVGRLGTGTMVATALCTVTYFVIIMALSIRRARAQTRLERLTSQAQGADLATGLPKGSVLLSKVDDAFWRSARMQRECTVICLHLRNLYELAEVAGHSADQQILAAMAARMRRAVGFRNVVGLYHPRCFVIVISARPEPDLLKNTLIRLRYLMGKPLSVIGLDERHYAFTPHFEFGAVTVKTSTADSATVIDQAERMALAANRTAPHPP